MSEDTKVDPIVSAVSSVACVVLNVLTTGYVVSTMWGWFAVPLGVHPLTFWGACGLRALVAMLTLDGRRPVKPEPDERLDMLYMWGLIVAQWIAFGVAWFFHHMQVTS